MEATPLNQLRPEVPVQVAAIVAKMMAKEPGQRFQQPQAVAQALRPFFKSGDAVAPASSIETIPLAEPPPMPRARPLDSDALPIVMPTLIESPGGNGRGVNLMKSPAMAIGVLVSALLASLSVAVWMGMGWNRDRVADRPLKPGPVAGPSTTARPKEAGPARPTAPDAEALFRDAVVSIRGGNLNQARMLLSQYITRPRAGKQLDDARILRNDIDLATSSFEAESQAHRLSDQELDGYLDRGVQPLVDSSVQSTDLRPVYAETLLQAFRQEKQRRESASKEGTAVALGPGPGTPPATEVPPQPEAEADRLPLKPQEPDPEPAPPPAKLARPSGPTTIEMILDAPRDYEGRTIALDEAFRIGTVLSPVIGADGQAIGNSIPIATFDDRTLCKFDVKDAGKVVGRDAYLVLDKELVPVLQRALQEFQFPHTALMKQKSTVTVEVRHLTGRDAGVPVLRIVGMEVVGDCDFSKVASRQYDKAFKTLRVTPQEAVPVYGDGLAWVERLGGEEKFAKPIRRRLRDFEKQMRANRDGMIVNAAIQAQVARAVNMTIASQQQADRFARAFFGR